MNGVGWNPQIDISPADPSRAMDLDRDSPIVDTPPAEGAAPDRLEASAGPEIVEEGSRTVTPPRRADTPLAPEIIQSIDDQGSEIRELHARLDVRTESAADHPLRNLLERIEGEYRELDGYSRAYMSGRTFTNQELIFLQMRAQGVAQQIELLSKGIEHAVSGIKTIVQSNA